MADRCESGAADPTNLAVGVMTGADYRASHGGASATFDGLAIAGGDVVLMATCAGDATLDGSTDAADLGVVLGAFGGLVDDGAPRWSAGDANYDGGVDTADLGVLLDAFGTLAGDPSSARPAVPLDAAAATTGVTVRPADADAPTDVAVTMDPTAFDAYTVTWADNSTAETGFTVYAAGPSGTVTLGQVAADVRTLTVPVSALARGTTYQMSVKAAGPGGPGGGTGGSSDSTDRPYTTPAKDPAEAPGSVEAYWGNLLGGSTGDVTVTWHAPHAGTAPGGYVIEAKDESDAWVRVGTAGGDDVSKAIDLPDRVGSAPATYHLRVRGVGPGGASANVTADVTRPVVGDVYHAELIEPGVYTAGGFSEGGAGAAGAAWSDTPDVDQGVGELTLTLAGLSPHAGASVSVAAHLVGTPASGATITAAVDGQALAYDSVLGVFAGVIDHTAGSVTVTLTGHDLGSGGGLRLGSVRVDTLRPIIYVEDVQVIDGQTTTANVIVTDSLGRPAAGMGLRIADSDSEVAKITFGTGGPTTDENGHTTLQVEGVGRGNTPVVLEQFGQGAQPTTEPAPATRPASKPVATTRAIKPVLQPFLNSNTPIKGSLSTVVMKSVNYFLQVVDADNTDNPLEGVSLLLAADAINEYFEVTWVAGFDNHHHIVDRSVSDAQGLAQIELRGKVHTGARPFTVSTADGSYSQTFKALVVAHN